LIDTDAKPNAPDRRRTVIIVAAFGVVVTLAIALATDAAALTKALTQLGWIGSGLVLGLSLLNYGLRFHRWTLYLGTLGHRISVGRHALYYLCGFAFTVSPAKAGEAVRSLYLARHGVRFSESIAALFVERLLDLLAMALLASLFVLDDPAYRPVIVAAVAITLGLVMIVGLPVLPRWIVRLAGQRKRRISKFLQGMASLLQSSRRMLQPRLLLTGLMLGLVAWGAEGLGFHLICRGLDIPLSLSGATGLYALAALGGGAAFFMPGGIGGMEVVMTSLLVARGVSLPVAVIATLLCRLATLWFAVIIGLGAAAVLESTAARPQHV